MNSSKIAAARSPRTADLLVLDASAVLAVLDGEDGADVVEPILQDAVISSVNFSEVAGKLVDQGIPHENVRSILDALQLNVRTFDAGQAYAAAELRGTAPRQLSLGDRACLALAAALGGTAVTADRHWAAEPIAGVSIRVIR